MATFSETLLANEVPVRLGFFFGILVLVGLWEIIAPRRALTASKGVRWLNNLGVVILNSLVVRVTFPLVAVGMAIEAQQRGWGLLNLVELPDWLALVIAVAALDLVIYMQHVMVHAVPLFWRLHRMHHADLDFDVTTGARFHPVEIILSMGIKLATVVLLGAPPVAVLIFEVVLNGTAMFNHGNIRLPLGLDRVLRWVVVTPDMHRVHHSSEDDEANSNFGFNLPWWDRLFGTYRAQPRLGHDQMIIGTPAFRDEKQCATLGGMLLMPFARHKSDAAVRGRFSGEHR